MIKNRTNRMAKAEMANNTAKGGGSEGGNLPKPFLSTKNEFNTIKNNGEFNTIKNNKSVQSLKSDWFAKSINAVILDSNNILNDLITLSHLMGLIQPKKTSTIARLFKNINKNILIILIGYTILILWTVSMLLLN